MPFIVHEVPRDLFLAQEISLLGLWTTVAITVHYRVKLALK